MVSRFALSLCVSFALIALSAGVPARAQVPELSPTAGLTGPDRDALEKERSALQDRLLALQSAGRDFNKDCGSVKTNSPKDAECARRNSKLEGVRLSYISDAAKFNNDIMRAKLEQRLRNAIKGGRDSLLALGYSGLSIAEAKVLKVAQIINIIDVLPSLHDKELTKRMGELNVSLLEFFVGY
jgi:hypothetical protein